MTADSLLVILIAAYGAAMAASISGLAAGKKTLEKIALCFLAIAFAFNTWAVAGRWIEGGQPPFKTLYETLVFYPWCVTAVIFVLIGLYRLYFLTAFAAAVSLLGLGYARYRPDAGIISLPPALQSGWFVPHVVTYFAAYASLFASFALALLAIIQPWWIKRREGKTGLVSVSFDQYAHQAVVFGVCLLTLGLVMGAVWGKFAWGDYWSWDPKENWALVSWLAYIVYLHLWLAAGWQGRKAMWILVFAFAAVIFTYLGMNLLPASTSSLHAYQ